MQPKVHHSIVLDFQVIVMSFTSMYNQTFQIIFKNPCLNGWTSFMKTYFTLQPFMKT